MTGMEALQKGNRRNNSTPKRGSQLKGGPRQPASTGAGVASSRQAPKSHSRDEYTAPSSCEKMTAGVAGAAIGTDRRAA